MSEIQYQLESIKIKRGYHQMITVDQIAQELAKADIPLLAGRNGLEQEIRYVTAIELKERTSRIQKNGLLLSTFHAFQDVEEIIDHLHWLVDVGVSAIGFHTSVYPDIPVQVKRFADDQGLPVFRIPAETPYNLIFELFNRMRQTIRDQARERIGRLNNLLIESILSRRSLRVIIEMIGEYMGGDVVFWIDSDLEVLEQWADRQVERGAVHSFAETIIAEKNRLQESRIKNEPCRLTNLDGAGCIIIYPIFSDSGFGGYLAFHFKQDQDAPEQDLMEEMIRTASKILMSDVYNPDKQGRQEAISILEKLLSGATDPHLVQELPDVEERMYQVVLIESTNQDNAGVLERVSRWVDMHAEQSSERFILFPPFIRDHHLVLLTRADSRIQQWKSKLPETEHLLIGVSDRAELSDASTYRRLHEQSEIVLKLCKQSGHTYAEWGQMGIEKVAAFLEGEDLFQSFAEQLLQPLIKYDCEKNTDLVGTLRVYLDNFFNLKKTGKELFIHPNTVKYRLETIRGLLPLNIEDSSIYALLVLAYRSYGDHP
ncbi:Sugar diacid utilization regulator [Bhargavaea cecembensis DSE10]|uniref:Sugar diacid utilization regulator n=1 Tax=Bhargavaea cecembensis DSE10 TaxID=1235279 RepID=M7NHH9_9BACL|nr:PucR family transcriptional regulator [Bhargavaea cecembensis]EMR06641.1 Sugar diacid utilization regulator [Bhargavaea cecembensis DSE10]